MRFTAGLIVGILIGRPVLSLVNDHLTPPIRRKITNGVKKEDLTDDDCAPDELVDQTTGLCAIMCGTAANPTRPNNGCK